LKPTQQVTFSDFSFSRFSSFYLLFGLQTLADLGHFSITILFIILLSILIRKVV